MIYRKIWLPGQGYHKGDAVTFGGSLWIACETTTAKPGETGEASRAWQLAVKKGAEGKIGPQGTKGEQGLPGAPGRDGTKW